MNSQFKKWALIAALTSGSMSAWADIVVVVGANADSLNKDQLTNLYMARSFDRKLVDLPEGTSLRNDFYKKLIDREPSQVKAIWARAVFTGKGQPPLMLPDSESVKKAVSTDPKAVGYIDKAQVDGSVKVLLTLD